MESFHVNGRGKCISVTIFGLVLIMISVNTYSMYEVAEWICGSGDWNDLSCWSFADYNPNDPPTIDRMYDAILIFSDDVDRAITRSINVDNPANYYQLTTTIDGTGSGTVTLIHTDGYAGQFLCSSHTIGVHGSGTLVQTGGRLTGGMYIGVEAGSSGTYDMIDGYSDTAEGRWQVGDKGNGLVNQSGGAISSSQLVLGEQVGGVGTYNLSGGHLGMGYNSQADISWIGNAGTGSFNQTGGTHRAETGFILGGKETGRGSYNLSGGSARAGMLIFGDEGEGTFTQTGGTLEVTVALSDYYPNGFFIGNQAKGHGTYNLIDGTFTMGAHVFKDVIVGNEGVGVINQFGGTFNIADCAFTYGSGCETYFGTGSLNIAKQAGSHGTFNLVGGTTVSNGVNLGIGGDGAFNQLGGSNEIRGTLAVANASQNGTGIYTLKGGTLEAENIVINENGTFNFDGGSVTTDLFANGGRVTLGDPAIDTTIDGNFAQLTSGTLALAANYDPSGTFDYDRLDVTQMAILGGTLDFSWDLDVGDLAYTVGDDAFGTALFEFDLLSADILLGEFDFLELPDLGALDPLYDWDVSYLLNDFGTDYVRLSMVRTPSTVPEPSTLLLLLPGLVGFGLAGRRRPAA